MSEMQSAPIYTIERSGITEISVHGVISVVEGDSTGSRRELLRFGDVDGMLWSRSLLKPWQLLSHLNELIENYPGLKPEHLALMMSSHSSEAFHIQLLKEILGIGHIADTLLQCPATFPLSPEMRLKLRQEGKEPRSLYHNCSGKHLGYLLTLKSSGSNLADYLDSELAHFMPLKELLSSLTGREENSFLATVDGCQLPNYALTPLEMASLYQGLAVGAVTENNRTSRMAFLCELMANHPFVIGGTDRFDSRLMAGHFTDLKEVALLAKGGADGLLGIGIRSCSKYRNGVGILVKTDSGYDIRHMEAIVKEILRQLDLSVLAPDKVMVGPPIRKDHIKTKFNFEVSLHKAV